ncbi:MAG: hypothetical protein AVDCRST_MAG31-1998 [uncultured Sphingomonas sp.]|uniref:Uncharacterized protein n=1 Tax=uncultured Sphingomonas sp. TaxID=158754 RepID=A0A6J4TLT3_9SPHN|nr:hypothetical protein [uncultured Sphingomonas sp.]CAA9526784.1 MAG: hypothetical protein AVDCRST_MAG31-1998 [uncultured Sphingomonas sp.]
MSKKFSAARERAFLRALEQSGNQTLSAEKAKVSRSWVKLHRKQDPAFDAACREAVAVAGRHLGELGSDAATKPPSGWRYLEGAELVVRSTRSGQVRICRAKLQQWSPTAEKRFLAALASTCNVQAACAEVGMSVGSAYRHRKTWVAFARAWDEAVVAGYRHLESALVLAGRNLFSDGAPAVLSPITEMTAAQALHLLHMHKHHVHGVGKGPHVALRSPLPEATARLEKVMRGMGLIPPGGLDAGSGEESA